MDHKSNSEKMEKMREQEEAMIKDIARRLAEFGRERSNLVPILQMIQEKHAYISQEAVGLVSDHLEIAQCEVYGVATFYNQFRFIPPGKNRIKVCLGTACHVRGGDIILENFERKLGIEEGKTTQDREFSIERVACVGCCALAPVAMVNDTVQGKMAPSKVEGILLGFQIEKEKEERKQREDDRQ
jgi:NADH-quinone oxidoreductase subunit E